MKILKVLIAMMALSLFISGCNTVRGAGQDIEKGGQEVQEAAEEVSDEIDEEFDD